MSTKETSPGYLGGSGSFNDQNFRKVCSVGVVVAEMLRAIPSATVARERRTVRQPLLRT